MPEGSAPPAKRSRPTGNGMQYDLVLCNCRVATMSLEHKDSPYGAFAGGQPAGCIAVKDGRIAWFGTDTDFGDAHGGVGFASEVAAEVHDMHGHWVTPGLIDCHTHIVYGGNRAGEWELKLKGATYEEVAKAGGGIVNTVDGTRKASVSDLVSSARPRVEALLREGVTTIEIKSGYGLNLAAERKMLQAARQLGESYGINVPVTYLGAHACPREYKDRQDEYIDTVVKDMAVLTEEGLVDCVDAFCETVGFTPEQTARVFDKAKELGLPVRLHGDQLSGHLGGAALAARYGALSCDHCEQTTEAGVAAMAASGTVAVLLPVSNYFIKDKQKPPVEAFRKAGVRIALGTNCNPGSSPCSSLLLSLNMACTLLGLTPEEAMLGVTRNGAAAIGQERDRGTIEVGKVADLAVWDVSNPCEISYYLGLNKLSRCYRGGRCVVVGTAAAASVLVSNAAVL